MKKSFSSYLKDYMMLLVLLAVIVMFAILTPILMPNRNFLDPQNLLNILGQNAYLVILGIGITFIMLGGGMDLSTGYLISTVGVAIKSRLPGGLSNYVQELRLESAKELLAFGKGQAHLVSLLVARGIQPPAEGLALQKHLHQQYAQQHRRPDGEL